MLSPMRAHKQRVLAIKAGRTPLDKTRSTAPTALPSPGNDTPEGREYAALRVALHDNLRTLSDIQSHEARIPKKAEFARTYTAWIDGALVAGESGQAVQDEILVTNLVWAVDYRDYDYALRLGEHAIRHHLTLPPGYTRTPACFLAEEIADAALEQADSVSLDQLLRLSALIDGADMPDPVRARLHKALGRAFGRRADAFDPADDCAPAGGKMAWLVESGEHYRRALALDANAGVKKDLERLARAIKAAATQETLPE